MQEIKCPKCGEVFKVDESDYAQIVKQVRDKEFAAELEQRRSELAEKKDSELKVIKMQNENDMRELRAKQSAALAELEAQIDKLSAQIENGETEKKLAIAEAVKKMQDELSEKQVQIEKLNNQIANGETEKKLAINEAVTEKDKQLAEKSTEITELRGRLENQANESKLAEQTLKEKYEIQLRMKDEQIEQYKDFKARQSTKMVGESLEQHCLTEFNRIRMTAFPAAYFEKDNDAKTGSKGDFIFRECGEDGTEFISIMFEMKNEMDTTATKHKNEDFFKELDKDRREKNCEYAVLVSLLEADSEYYNSGICDVSYRYEKMYVVRPQFFIPMITLLRNAALNTLKYKQEIKRIENQQIDITNFEANIEKFKEGFGKNYRLASEQFQKAINEIDASIEHLKKVKEQLTKSENNLRLANNKATDELTVKKLTKNAPSVKAMFEALPNGDDS